MFESLLWSMTFRPYVTVFLLAFLALSYVEQGLMRTVIWIFTGYLIAFTAEWGSINYGIPFGWYAYDAAALAHDLVVCGVPFFDSLSFSFLSYVSFSFAQYLQSPLLIRGFDVQRVTLRATRNSPLTLLLGSMLMVVTDLIIDPIALQGRYWALGEIYHYPEPGIHFGVPLANYGGWFVVAILTLWLNQRIDEYLTRNPGPGRGSTVLLNVPAQGLLAPLFWTGIVAFQLKVTLDVGLGGNPEVDRDRLLLQALTGAFIVLPILVLALLQIIMPSRQAHAADIAQWLREGNGRRLTLSGALGETERSQI
ncbi:MAG: carotenoid biosynthesis protein [Gammaproteobacteria bacterium]|nr:carotenoid biosynthesis protein [Gammaproteobacteria bacterium]